MIIRIIVEFLLIVLMILGFIYEPALARWEDKQKERILKELKKRKALRK